MKAGSHVPRKSEHRQQRTKSQLSQKGKKGEMPHTFLDNDLNFMDTILMGLNSIDADLKRPDDIRNPYDFNLWWSAPVEPLGIKNTENLETLLYEMSTNVGLQNSNDLSSLKAIDFYGTISTLDSTGSAPKNLSTQSVRLIVTDEV